MLEDVEFRSNGSEKEITIAGVTLILSSTSDESLPSMVARTNLRLGARVCGPLAESSFLQDATTSTNTKRQKINLILIWQKKLAILKMAN